MIWTNKGLKQRIAELEQELTSVKSDLKESKYQETHAVNMMNLQHGLIVGLKEKLGSLTEIHSDPVERIVKPGATAYSIGKKIAQSLKRRNTEGVVIK